MTFLSIGDNEHGFSLRWTAIQAGAVIQALIAKNVLEVAPKSAPVRINLKLTTFGCLVFGILISIILKGIISGFIARVASALWPQGEKPWYPFMSKLAASGRPMNELVATIVGLAVGSSVNYAQGMHVLPPPCNGQRLTGMIAAVQVIDVYLDDQREAERNHIRQLAGSQDPSSTEVLRGYVREAMR